MKERWDNPTFKSIQSPTSISKRYPIKLLIHDSFQSHVNFITSKDFPKYWQNIQNSNKFNTQ